MAAARERGEGKESESSLQRVGSWNSKCRHIMEEKEEFDDDAEDDIKGAEGKEADFAEFYRGAREETLEDDRTMSINLKALQERKREREKAAQNIAKTKEEAEARESRWKTLSSRTDSVHL